MRTLLAVLVLCVAGAASAAPLTLTEAIAAARHNHPDARVARSTEDAARANTGVALAGYLPNLSFTALGRGDESNFTPLVVGTAASTTTTFPFQGSLLYSGSLALNQLLFDGGRTLGQLAAARAQLVQSTHDRHSQELAIEAAVTAAYFAALEADALLAVAADFEAQQRATLTSVKKVVSAGIRPELDAISAETRVERAALDRIRAQGAVATRRASLLSSLGLEDDPGFSLVDTFTNETREERQALDELVGRALRERPEVAALVAQSRVAERQLHAARSDYFPSLSLGLGGTMTGSNENPKPLFDFFATLNLQEQLFTGLSTYRGAQAARAQLEAARAKIAGVRVVVRGAVASARAGLEVALRSDAQATLLVKQADRLVTSAQKRYDAGVLTLIELFDAQGQRLLALGQRVSSHYAVALGRADLRRAVGGSLLEGGAR